MTNFTNYRGLLIDPFAKTVTTIQDRLGDFMRIRELLLAEAHKGRTDESGSPITYRPMSTGPLLLQSPFDGLRIVTYIDDEGLFRRDQKFFKLAGCSDPIPGIAVVCAAGREGETASVPYYVTEEALAAVITWHEREEIAAEIAPVTITAGFGADAQVVQSIPIDILDESQWSE